MGVMKRTLGFFEDETIGAAADNRDGLRRGLHAGDFDDTGTVGLNFFDQIGGAEFVFGEGVDVSNGFASSALVWSDNFFLLLKNEMTYPADEFDLIPFNVLDAEYAKLGQEVKAQIVDGIPEY